MILKRVRLLFSIFITLCIYNVSGQNITKENTFFFSDTTLDDGFDFIESQKHGDRIYVSGGIIDKKQTMPVLVCSDLQGNVIWKTTDYDNYVNFIDRRIDAGLIINFTVAADGYIYATAKLIQPEYNNGSTAYWIWKINASNGKVEWRKPPGLAPQAAAFNSLNVLRSLNKDTLLVIRGITKSNTLGLNILLSKIDKSNGKLLSSDYIGAGVDDVKNNFALDSKGKMYFGILDTLFCIDVRNPSVPLWKRGFDSLDLEHISEIFIEEDSLFLIGSTNDRKAKGLFCHIDAPTGNTILAYTISDNSNSFSNGLLYPTKNDFFIYWPGSSQPFNQAFFTRINRKTGKSISSLRVFGLRDNNTAFCLAVKDSGDFYIGGERYQTPSRGGYFFASLKLINSAGSYFYDTAYTKNINRVENPLIKNIKHFGRVRGIYHYNDSLLLVGRIKDVNQNILTLNSADANTGALISKTDVKGNYQYYSYPKEVFKLKDSTTAILVQKGQESGFYWFNNNDTFMKSHLFSRNFYLEATCATRDPLSNNLYFGAYSLSYADKPGREKLYFSLADTLHLFKVSRDNGLVEENKLAMPENTFCYPLDIVVDSNKAFYFYMKEDSVYVRSISGSNWSNESTVGRMDVGVIYKIFNYYFKPPFYIKQTKDSIMVLLSNNSITDWVYLKYVDKKTLKPGKYFKAERVGGYENKSIVILDSNNIIIAQRFGIVKTTLDGNYQNRWRNHVEPNYIGNEDILYINKIVLDSAKKYIYTAEQLDGFKGVRKISVATGENVETYYPSDSVESQFWDVAYYKDTVIACGYVKRESNLTQNVHIVYLDTNLNLLKSITHLSPWYGDEANNHANFVRIINGKVVVGGYLTDTAHGITGFMMGLYDSTSSNIAPPPPPPPPPPPTSDRRFDGINKGIDVTIYPNPFKNNLTIKFETDFTSAKLNVFDVNGRMVHHQKFNDIVTGENTKQLNLTLPSGIYFFELKTKEYIVTQKVICE